MVIYSIGALYNPMNNSLASSPLWYLSSLSTPHAHRNLAPALDRYVQGGCAIIKWYLPLYASIRASHCICHSGCHPDDSMRSQEKALYQSRRNSLHIACDSSQAMSMFVVSGVILLFYGYDAGTRQSILFLVCLGSLVSL